MSRSKRENEFPDNGFEMWGGYMNAKIAKLEEQFLEQASKEAQSVSSIFSGISIFVNGYTTPTANELKVIMAEHGGIYHHYFKSDKTKFIIASNLPDTKVKNLPTTKIVKPEWISDSVAAGILLDYKDYLLYCNHSKTQPRLNFRNVDNTVSNKEVNSTNATDTVDQDMNVDTRRNIDTTDCKTSPTVPISKVSPNQENITKNKCAMTAVDPGFLSEFYNNSRLHHISQLGAGFKQCVNELRDKSDFNFPMRDSIRKLVSTSVLENKTLDEKTIMHIDMDCFFVSVGLRKHPHLRGKPVAVTHSKGGAPRQKRDGVNRYAEFNMYNDRKKNKMQKAIGKELGVDLEDIHIKSRVDNLSDEDGEFGSMSEIASCSYEARARGIHNGMFMGSALRLCPELKTIPYDFDAYKDVAFLLYNTVAEYTLDIEAVSCDEMYVDCTELLRDVGLTAMEFATILRESIKEKTGCPCSTGFGANRLQARMATKKAKPNGQYRLPKEDVEVYFSSVPLSDLPGVGYQMENKLTALGYTDCASLRIATLQTLQKHFGNKTGLQLYNHCRGIDDKPLHYTTIRKSISAGVNYGIRFEDNSHAEAFLRQLCHEVCSRMSQNKVVGKAITLKLMVRSADAPVETAKYMGHGFCDNITKTTNLAHCTDDVDIIIKEVLELCKKINTKPEEMRGISIQVCKLEDASKKVKNQGGIQIFLKKKNQEATLDVKNTSPLDSKTSPNIASASAFQNDNNVREIYSENFNNQSDSPSKHVNFIQNSTTSNITNNKSVAVCKKQTSPMKRSKSLGLTGRRRGRPPKHLSVTNNSAKSETNKTINMFLNNASNTSGFNNPATVDEDFLNALPDDIRNEIMANYKIKSKQPPDKISNTVQTPPPPRTNKPETSHDKGQVKSDLKIDPEYLLALPEELRKEIEENIEMYSSMSYVDRNNPNNPHEGTSDIHRESGSLDNQKLPSSSDTRVQKTTEDEITECENISAEEESDVVELDWRQMRSMLRSWFASTEEPMQCDVEVVSTYLRNLVYKKNIEDLYCLMNFLHRILSEEHTCKWHQVYLGMEDQVQQAMLEVYENKLSTNTIFSCCATK